MARRYQDAGARWLHVIDLDGARAGRPGNLDAVRRIVAAAPAAAVEVGGGIRDTEVVAQVLAAGVRRVIVGTRAVREPQWLRETIREYPGRVVLGLDARGGRLAVEGWQRETAVTVLGFLEGVRDLPLAAIVYTDILRDGMMSGPNVEATAELARASPFPVIASGGVTTLEDVVRLGDAGAAGAIIGRALYEGTLTVEAALAACLPAGGPPVARAPDARGGNDA